MSGLYGVIGIIAVFILTYFCGKWRGKEETTTKISGQVVIEQQKAKKVEKEKDLALETAKIVSGSTAENNALNEYFEEFEQKVTEAKQEQNPELAIAAAQSLAQRANNWKERNMR